MDINSKVETARVMGAASGVIVYSLTLNEWVAVATIIYVVMQSIILTPKVFKIIGGLAGFIRAWFLRNRGHK